MKFAIIAAGEGRRLAAEGISEPKPLLKVNGEMLIDRLIRIFVENNAEEVDVICNDLTNLVSGHLLAIEEDGLHGYPVPLQMHVKSTPSALHSIAELEPKLAGRPFVLTTVDTVVGEREFAEFVKAFGQALDEGYDGLMGVTEHLEEHHPLYADTDGAMNVTAYVDQPQSDHPYISAGVYGLTSKAFDTLHACLGRGDMHRRQFLRALLADGLKLKAFAFSEALDIDHKADLDKAGAFLRGADLGKF